MKQKLKQNLKQTEKADLEQEIRKERKEKSELFSAVIAVAAFYGILYILGITCPIKWLTGISCAGCGMTRAWFSALRLDFKAAFYYHPLFFTVPFALAVIFFKEKIPKWLRYSFYTALVIAFTAVYIYRMLSGCGDVVVFRPTEGFIEKTIYGLFIKNGNNISVFY